MDTGGLLFIPDITGFTKFINDTEIEHSRYIIEELLEILINSNQIGLNISEIEGDAILFYRFGEPPALEDIYQQVEKMFCNFQKQIKNYESRRVCPCSACKGAVNLSLKIITHLGKFSTYKVKEYSKLIGKDVILAHQLLKNDIDIHEYWLVTSELFHKKPAENLFPDWLNWEASNKQTENGEVNFHYSLLSQLKEKVQPDPALDLSLGNNKVRVMSVNKTIYTGMPDVFSIMGNFSLRPLWQEGIRGVDQVSHPIYHVGVKHRCILDKRSVILYTSSFSQANDIITLVETDEKKMGEMHVTLQSLTDGKTLVTLDYYLRKNPLIQLMFSLFMKKKLTRQLTKSLENLQTLCEQGNDKLKR
jgi:hypothetical protein